MSIHPIKASSVVVCFAFACGCLAGQTPIPEPVKGYYAKADQLLRDLNVKELEKLTLSSHTKDFQSSSLPDKSGKVTHRSLAEAVRTIRPQLDVMQEFTKVSSHIDGAKGGGDSMVLTVSSNIAATTRRMRDGQAHKIVVIGVSEDTWVKSGATWQLKTTKAISHKVTYDGQLITR